MSNNKNYCNHFVAVLNCFCNISPIIAQWMVLHFSAHALLYSWLWSGNVYLLLLEARVPLMCVGCSCASFSTFHCSSPLPPPSFPVPSYPLPTASSSTIFPETYMLHRHHRNKTKTTGRSCKKDNFTKTSVCRDGTLKNQPNEIRMAPQYFTLSLHLVPFCQLSTPQNSVHI